MSGSFQDSFEMDNFNGNVAVNNGPSAGKRRRTSDSSLDPTLNDILVKGRTFLPVYSGSEVFHTQEWKASGTALFTPVTQDVYINLAKYDQVTAAQGSFYTADEAGNFSKMAMGHVVHLWRHSQQQRKFYISQSFLFTNLQEFMRVQAFLQNV